MSDKDMSDTERSATAEEIREWEEEHDEPHPVFKVEHRPERKRVFEDDRCPVCGYKFRGMPTVYRLYNEKVHRRCRGGLPEDINPNSRYIDTGTDQQSRRS